MASASDVPERFQRVLAAELALRDAKTAFGADLAPGVVRIVLTDDDQTAYYRAENRLKEAQVELVDLRTAPAPAPQPTLP